MARVERGAGHAFEGRGPRRRADRRLDRPGGARARGRRGVRLRPRRARARARARARRDRRRGRRRGRRRRRRRRRVRRRARRRARRGGRRALAARRPRLRGQRRRLHQARRRRRAAPTSASSAATRSPAPRRAGVEHARADLFDGATWYLTPARGSTAGVLYERLHRLLSALRRAARRRSTPTPTTALMACVSHLPHVLANLLVAQAASLLAGRGGLATPALPAVGPSFRDATRVAGANSAIWTDIYLSNRDALIAGDRRARRAPGARCARCCAAADAARRQRWNERARADREALLGAGAAPAGARARAARLGAQPPRRHRRDRARARRRRRQHRRHGALALAEDNRQGVVALWIGGEASTPSAPRS